MPKSEAVRTVGVIGLGYVGLPLIREFMRRDFIVTGFDIDKEKVALLENGVSYLKHFPTEVVQSWSASRRFRPTTDFSLLSECEHILICVPTPLDAFMQPDLSHVENTARTIARYLRRGQLVVLESTTYPGTTEEVVLPILEETGLRCGADFFLAYSPEREDPGNPDFTTASIPKVVGGHTPTCMEKALALYAHIVKPVPVSSMKVAEASKILENTYRAVNIAMVNELKMLFLRMGIDIWEVIAAASTKPFGFQPFYPGPGLGGHYIPIDPFYLTWKAKQVDFRTRFIELAGEINTHQPYYVVQRVAEILNQVEKPVKNSRILILGMAYKRDVDDMRESPSLKIYELLRRQGAVVEYYDPLVPETGPHRHFPEVRIRSIAYSPRKVAQADLILLLTDHSLLPYTEIHKHARLILDTRNRFPNHSDKVHQA